MKVDRQTRKAIQIGIVTSVIVIILINPIINLAQNLLQEYTNLFLDFYGKKLILNVAKGTRNSASTQIYVLGNSIGIGMFIGTIYTLKQKFNRKTEDLEKTFNEDGIKEDEPTLESLKEKFSKTKKSFSKLLMFSYFSIFFFSVLAFNNIITSIVDLEMNTKFNQRLNSICHKITDNEEEELISKWARMKDWNDYITIHKELDQIAHKYKIEIPSRN